MTSMASWNVPIGGGMYLHVKTVGRVGHPSLLLLHDLVFDSRMWEEMIPHFLKAGFRVVTVDLPGCWFSDSPLGVPYSLEQIATWVLAAVKSVGFHRAHVLGLGMGGMVALRMAYADPAFANSLVLLGTSAAVEPPGRQSFFMGLAERARLAHLLVLGERVALAAELLLYLFETQERAILDPWQARLVEILSREEDCEGLYWSAVATLNRLGLSLEALVTILAPAFIGRGGKDAFRTFVESNALSASLPNASGVVEWPKLGHMCMLEAPGTVANDILTFLKEVT